jgi:hypothetical protein
MIFNSTADFYTAIGDNYFCHRLPSNLFIELEISSEDEFNHVVSVLNEDYKPGVSHWDDHVYDTYTNAFNTLPEALAFANVLAKHWSTTAHGTTHGPKF